MQTHAHATRRACDRWNDDQAAHGVSNLTSPSPDDDALYNADSFNRFAESLGGAPFLAQISFHNCHIPFVGTPDQKARCRSNSTESSSSCAAVLPGAAAYSDEELDFYACLNEFDNSVGLVLAKLKELGYYNNTMIWYGAVMKPPRTHPMHTRPDTHAHTHTPTHTRLYAHADTHTPTHTPRHTRPKH